MIRFLLLFCWPVQLCAQVFMSPFDNAVASTLGGAVVAYPGVQTGLSNDAAVGLAKAPCVFASSALPFGLPEWQTASVQACTNIGKSGGVGVDIQHSGIDTYQEQQFRLLYGRKLGSKWSLGGSFSFLRVAVPEYGNHNHATFSMSVLANPLPKLWIGAKVHNPVQQKSAGYLLPTVLRIGAVWQANAIFSLLGEVEKDLERSVQVKLGAEYRVLSSVSLRMGVRTGDAAQLGFGAGFHLKNGLSIHTGTQWHTALGFTPSAALVYSFRPT